MTQLLTACGGFLVAVLWMDLIFDVQVIRRRKAGDVVDEPVLASIAGYYRRATTTSRPMSYLIAAVMLILLSALAFQVVRGRDTGWLSVASALLAGFPILLALVHTVPNAVRLGSRRDTAATQTRLAISVCRDHLVCLVAMVAFVVLRIVCG